MKLGFLGMKQLQKSFVVLVLLIVLIKLVLSDWFKKIFPTEFMKGLIINYSLYFNIILFGVFVCFIYLNWSKLIRPLKSSSRKTWLLLIAIILLALFLRLTLSPLYDPARSGGWEYNLMARGYVEHQTYDLCIAGSFNECDSTTIPDHNPGFAFVLTFLFMILGINGSLAIATNIILGTLTAFIVFLITIHLLRNEKTGLWAAFIISILPLHIIYSGISEITSSLLFVISLSVLCITVFAKEKNLQTLSLSLISLLFAFNFQITNVPLIIVFFFAIVLFFDNPFKTNKKNLFIYLVPLVICVLLMIPYMYILTQPVAFSGGVLISADYFERNLNAFLLENKYSFPWLTMGLFIIGFIHFKEYWREKTFVLAWAVSYMLLYMVLFSPHMERYTIDIYPVIAIFAAIGVVDFFRTINIKKKVLHRCAIIGLVLLLLFSAIPFSKFFAANNDLHLNFSEYSSVWWGKTILLGEIVSNMSDNLTMITTTDAEVRKLLFETNKKVVPARLVIEGDWSRYIRDDEQFVFLKTERFSFNQRNFDFFSEYFGLSKEVVSDKYETIELYFH